MHVHCQNDGLHPSLDPVYNNIAACPWLEMPDSINHQREEERPKLSSESNSSVFTVKKDYRQQKVFSEQKESKCEHVVEELCFIVDNSGVL